MKKFWAKLGACLTSTDYYRFVLYQPFWDVVRFYAVFLALLAGMMTLFYWSSVRFQLYSMVETTISELEAGYPSDLKIEWTGSELHASIIPLFVSFPSTAPQFLKDQATYLAIYTATESATPPASTLFLVTPQQLHDVEEGRISGGVQLADFLGSDTFTITEQNLPTFMDRAVDMSRSAISALGFVYPIGAYLLLWISSLYVAVFETVIIFVLIKLQGIRLSFRQLFQLSLTILVPAQIINTVTTLAQLHTPISMLTLSFWILFIFIFFSIQRKIAR